MQNSIIKQFENNPNVVTRIVNTTDPFETWDWIQVFWSNYYMRAPAILDTTGAFAGPRELIWGGVQNGLPFGRGYIIDQNGKVAYSYFGHYPQTAIAEINKLLE